MTFPVENILFCTDSYKVTHHVQYPPATKFVYSYFESRGGKFKEVCFFGLQYIIKRWLLGPVVTDEMISEAKQFYKEHFLGLDVFNEAGWRHIVTVHGGRLPLRIKAVPEGAVIPTHNVLFTVENTDPAVPWLTNWFETLLVQCWYPITVATSSRAQKQLIAQYLSETAESMSDLPFQLHDFGYRGCSSVESAAIGDAAHLVNFHGTDNIAGIRMLKKYYHHDMAGYSIPAAEHSTITSWSKNNEVDAYRNILQRFPDGPVSVVSDSYDLFKCVQEIWCAELLSLVHERAARGGRLVIRPDSGDPMPVVLKVLQILRKSYPVSVNQKGYKVLPPYLRIIQGDGINYDTIRDILENMKQLTWSAENVVFGTGGSLLQRIDRDTQKCAFKCCYVSIDGAGRNVFKDPVTDAAKKSKRGRLTLERLDNGGYVTMEEDRGDPAKDVLVTVFEDGILLKDYTLDEIRERAELPIVQETRQCNDHVNVETNHIPQ